MESFFIYCLLLLFHPNQLILFVRGAGVQYSIFHYKNPHIHSLRRAYRGIVKGTVDFYAINPLFFITGGVNIPFLYLD
jgi:hypothetical protein